MKQYNFLYTTDNNYFMHMLTSIYSLLENNKDIYLNIHIIEDNLDEINKTRLFKLEDLYNNIKINLYSIKLIEDIMNRFSIPKWRNTNIANARLFANEIIKNTDTILYIDCDTIITNQIRDIFNYSLNNPVSATREICIPDHIKNKLNYYYNSGILLFNYNLWDNENCIDKLYKTINKNKNDFVYPDQDLLNFSIENIGTLDISYNMYPLLVVLNNYPFLAKQFYTKKHSFYTYEEIEQAINNPHIYHNLSYQTIRPWEKNNIHPYNDLYKYYRTLWDNEYIETKCDSILAKSKLISHINILTKSLLDDEIYTKIKEKVIK